MSDSDVKLVKVDNWGIYFLQRLKHFFNRTDYCDLTLQFQDNAQLKVHRLVLSACTEYFELLERTCEMYEDCLVMPDDLQADVVVPIVNFMYTGQLEFRMDLLERLYLTSQIMDMPVLTKLLDAHRQQTLNAAPIIKPTSIKRSYAKCRDPPGGTSSTSVLKNSTIAVANNTTKRPYSTAFGNKSASMGHKPDKSINNGVPPPYHSPDIPQTASYSRKAKLGEPRPTRYELPEELDTDNIFDNSFTNISYTSQPLMVHPESYSKYYSLKKTNMYGEPSGSHSFKGGTSTLEIVECKKVPKSESLFEVDNNDIDEADLFQLSDPLDKVSNQLFDQIIDQNEGTKVTIETKDAKQAANIDHAKIISEVLKKYPHLVKSNKNIKLKILNTPSPTLNKPQTKLKKQTTSTFQRMTEVKPKSEEGFTYESDVLDSKEAAKLIALGAENVQGPWICLICGTPGKAIHFTSYYKFRRHLVEVHNEKPIANMCEYCGLKSLKRNYLLHHLLIKHGVEPPPSYRFPKCNQCSYVALTEGFLVKHKLSHSLTSEAKNFRCNVCTASYNTSNQLLTHIQTTGHKYTSDSKKPNLQCIYCMKVFLRETNFYAHLKTLHKQAAKSDGIIDDSDEEIQQQQQPKFSIVKYEPKTDDDEMETQYQITPDGNIDIIQNKKQRVIVETSAKQKILNSGFSATEQKPVKKMKVQQNIQDEFQEEVVMIDNTEYIMRDNQLIPKKKPSNEYILSDLMSQSEVNSPSTSMEYTTLKNAITEDIEQQKVTIKKTQSNVNQPIQIVVSNEEEYKALMNSNQTIIFDDGDSNKTLTVLSAPHTTLNTTDLELSNNQSGDMMIIPEMMDVSEALPTSNSNIVVVYSHSVQEQDKQFQILTSPDIGPQFVQSSAVITQNFETITTTTPIMNAHAMDAEVTQVWPNNSQSNQQVSQLQELTEMTVIQTQENEANTNTTLNDLPEVTLTPKDQEVVTNEHVMDIEKNLSEANEVTENINVDTPEEEEEAPNDSVQSIEESTETLTEPTEVVIDDPVIEDAIADTSQQILANETLTQDNNTETDNTSADLQSEIEQDSEELEELPETAAGDVVVESTETTEAPHIEEQGEVEVDQVTPIAAEANKVVPEIAKEQIQSLTADWSEDEYDTEEQVQEQQVEENSTENVEESITEAEPEEVEESIESIQQEMQKQISDVSDPDCSAENVENKNVSAVTKAEKPVVALATEAPQEKISSLLNDWDENDSQEENDTTDDVDEIDPKNETTNVLKEGVEAEIKSAEPKKDDKIQSLVNDWDEDEEDIKN